MGYKVIGVDIEDAVLEVTKKQGAVRRLMIWVSTKH